MNNQPFFFILRKLVLIGILWVGQIAVAQDNINTYNIQQQRNYGLSYLNQDDFDQAFVVYSQMNNYAEQNHDEALLFEAKAGKTIAAYLNQDLELADSLQRCTLKGRHAPQPGNENALASLHYVRAGLAIKNKAYTETLQHCDSALFLAINTATPDTSLLGRIYNLRGLCYFRLTQHEKALNDYINAKKTIAKFSVLNPLHNVKYTQNIAMVYASRQDYDQALPYFDETLALKQKYKLPPSRSDISYNNNLGRVFFSRNEYERASKHFNEAIRITITLYGPDHELLGDVYLNQGNLYTQIADYPKAREYYKKALTLIRKYRGPDDPAFRILNNNIAYTYQRQEENRTAIGYYKTAIHETDTDLNTLIALRNTGQCYFGINNTDSAAYYFRKAVELAENQQEELPEEYALALQDYGQFLLETNQHQEGIRLLFNSLTLFTENNTANRNNEAYIHTLLGSYYSRHDSTLPTALHHFQKALIAQEESFESINYADNPDILETELPYELLGVLAKKANVLYKHYRVTNDPEYLNAASSTYSLSIALIDRLKKTYRYDESKLFISGQSNTIFQQALRVAHDLYTLTGSDTNREKAFYYAEKTKYSTLLEAYRENLLRKNTIPETLSEKQATLQKSLEKNTRNLYIYRQNTMVDQEIIDKYNATIFDLNRTIDHLNDSIRTNFPEYYYANSSLAVISITDIQKKLRRNQVLMEYSLQDSLLFIFFISQKEFHHTMEVIVPEYIDSLRHSVISAELGNYTGKEYTQFIHASHYLYTKFIGPFRDKLKNKSIILIPDSKAGYIPFDALITTKPNAGHMDYRNLSYLIHTNTISYSYSSTLLFEKESRPIPLKKVRLLAFAPDYTLRHNTPVNDTLLRSLMPIPGAREEVEGICTLYNGVALTEEKATEHNFKQKAPDYDILHLAMHTLIDEENPAYSKIIFSPTKQDSTSDGLLFTSELFTLSLNARMAVLSACQTGEGKIREGEGILSLARGFFYAGVPSVIMTLWPVDDISSATIMNAFYRQLKKGHRKDKALRQAKLDFLAASDPVKSHPRFWSGYISIGDQNPVVAPLWVIGYLALALLAAGSLGWFLFRKK